MTIDTATATDAELALLASAMDVYEAESEEVRLAQAQKDAKAAMGSAESALDYAQAVIAHDDAEEGQRHARAAAVRARERYQQARSRRAA